MTDQELKHYLEKISSNTEKIAKKGFTWSSLFNGILSGFGSIVGVVIALTIIGWVLNVIGVIPTFRHQVDQWQNLLEQAQQRQVPAARSAR